jgi:hypothetical protein
MKCHECGKVGSDTNWKYCSIACRNKAVARLPRGDCYKSHMSCSQCSKSYLVKNSQVKRSKFCSRQCRGLNLQNRKKICGLKQSVEKR